MENLDAQIAQMKTQLTSALKRGEPENSPQMLQMNARLEWMRHFRATHRQTRLGLGTSEGQHVRHVN
jgi:hypothetical protein